VINFPLYTYTAVAGYLQRRECGNRREAIGGAERLKRGEPKTKRAILTLAKFQTLPKYSDNKYLYNSL